MTCANPIAWATLVDYWAGDLNDAETAVVDEHLFGCESCTPRRPASGRWRRRCVRRSRW